MTPEEIVERAAEVLVRHASIPRYRNGVEDWDQAYCPECGTTGIYGPNSPDHAKHQAQALADAGLILTPEREREIRMDEREKRADVIRPFDRGAAAAVLFLAEPRPLTELEIVRGQQIARLIAEEAGR